MTIFAIDFDGTCVEHDYPRVGADVPGAVDTLLALVDQGHELILWTMRSGDVLEEALAWFEARGIPIRGANVNPDQRSWTDSPKVYAQVYIDDAALGCPLIHPAAESQGKSESRPYVDWPAVRRQLQRDHYLPASDEASRPTS